MASSLVPYGDRVEEVLRSASRRRLLVEAAEQLAWTLGIILSGFVLMMLLGTATLGWGWMALLTAVGLVIFALRLRAQLMSPYRVAQMLDRRLSLQDAFSPAHFLLSSSAADHGPATRFQLEQTSRIAATARVEKAFPFKAKRAWAICGALAAVSFGLFALRFLLTQSLNLRPPLVAVQMPPVFERLQDSLRPKHDVIGVPPSTRRYAANPTTADRNEKADKRSLPTERTEPAGAADRNGDLTQGQQTQDADTGNKQGQDGKGEPRAGSQPSSQGESSPQTEERNGPQGGAPNASAKEQRASNGNNTPGLMNRMKDALSSMVAKMRANGAPQQPGQQQRSEGGQNEAKNGQNNAASKAEQGGKGEQARNDQSSESQNAEGQAQGQTAERPQNAQASSGQSAQKGSDAQSGVGRQDGDKSIKNAEQLQAMGKLADLIGKRSANLTGDMTIETPSGKQQLKTEYSQQTARHSDSGGEINRNEIPMMYQQYVREYMEQVGKQRERSKP